MTDRYLDHLRRIVAIVALPALFACGDAGTDEHEGEEHEDEHVENVVVLDSAGIAMAGIRLAVVETISVGSLPVTGALAFDENRVSHIGPRTEGRVVAMRADLGERVRRGQVLAVLESPEVGVIRADMHEAEALVRIARENYERERQLQQQGIASRREVLDAEAELRRAEAALLRAAERLAALGASQGSGAQFAITAPFDGAVAQKHGGLGEVVGTSDQLFTIADLSRLWLELDIYERDLASVSVGQDVDVTTSAYPGRTFTGRIISIGSLVDAGTRTTDARVELANPDGALRPGMFASAHIRTGGDARALVVPLEAVQELEGETVVFVPDTNEPGTFHVRPVRTGETIDDRVIVQSGLSAGEEVVTTGSFLLRSELAEGEIGDHGH